LKRFTVDAIAGLAFGSEVNTLQSGEDVIQRHLDTVLDGLYRRVMAPLPYWRWVRLPSDRRIERSNAALRVAIEDFIARARERMRADPGLRERPRNLLEAMLAAADAGDAGVDDRDVAGNVSTMLFAGEDTTANTLAWLIWLLHRHPAALDRARDEVRRVVPDLARATQAQLDALDWLDACASEAMRLKPVAPFLIAEALHDTVVADVRVPKGTVVWCVLRGASLDERRVPDAGAFRPERWLGEANWPRKVAMPFGSGPRTCPGRYLALLEIKLAMAMLLGAFEIDRVEASNGADEPQEVMHFTMNPTPLRMRLRVKQ
jgi:cytochrome P450